jgi:hypothetical protein
MLYEIRYRVEADSPDAALDADPQNVEVELVGAVEYPDILAEHDAGAHDEAADVECNYCRQLFDSTREDAIDEAEAMGWDLL